MDPADILDLDLDRPAGPDAPPALDTLGAMAWRPERPGPAGRTIPDIQVDLAPFIPPAQLVDGVEVPLGPVFTAFATARLTRRPTPADQAALAHALDLIERSYPWAPQGVFTFVGYGLPYFRRLPESLVFRHLPRLRADTRRFVLEEAAPGPADVHPGDPAAGRKRFPVPVRIDADDLVLTVRSDHPDHIADVLRRLAGAPEPAGRAGGEGSAPGLGGLLALTSIRVMFSQVGMPRRVADGYGLVFAPLVNPHSSRWTGLLHPHGPGPVPAPEVTFAGPAGLTTAEPGDYFDHGTVQHLSHAIEDLYTFYGIDDDGRPGGDTAFLDRVRGAFRTAATACPPGAGGPARAPGGVDRRPGGGTRPGAAVAPLLRVAGPGFDALDVPGGAAVPKLQHSAFAPAAALLAAGHPYAPPAAAALLNGLAAVRTVTRRQNFLLPPRRHRAFPLLELA